MTLEKSSEEINLIINNIYSKYKNEPIIIEKINKYIDNIPNFFDNIYLGIQKKKERQDYINNLKENIFDEFVHIPFTHYFFIQSSKLYINYDGINYNIIPEDDIVVKLIKKINENSYSKQYKKKFKKSIMRNIREIDFFSAIPESITIQNIVKFFSNIFGDKFIAKYFLTIIGDIINKKKDSNNEHNIYFIPEHFKNFIDILSIFYSDTMFCETKREINCDFNNYFKTKKTDNYKNKNCRLIPYQNNFYFDDNINNYIKTNILNILCVSNYYSTRYNSSDDYLNTNHNDINFYINYIKNNTDYNIVNDFIINYIIIVPNTKKNDFSLSSSPSQESNFIIPYNEIFYLWKEYLNDNNYPYTIITNSSFKQNLNNILVNNFDTQTNKYFNITSSYLSYIQSFQEFWSDNMIKKENYNNLEINEFISLFSIWCNNNNKSKIKNNEDKFISLIDYFYGSDMLSNDKKYLSNIYCKLWDKKKDIETYYLLSSFVNNNTPIIKRYKEYCDLVKNNKINDYKLTMNKIYFEELFTNFIKK